jgi:hypothetical protein
MRSVLFLFLSISLLAKDNLFFTLYILLYLLIPYCLLLISSFSYFTSIFVLLTFYFSSLIFYSSLSSSLQNDNLIVMFFMTIKISNFWSTLNDFASINQFIIIIIRHFPDLLVATFVKWKLIYFFLFY